MKRFLTLIALSVLLVAGSTAAQGVCCAVPGDADDNGAVSIGDAVYLINFIFGGGPASVCMEEGDADGNGAISIGDAVYIINFIFGGGPAPVACPIANFIVFQDEYGARVTYEAFGGSLLDAVQIEVDSVYAGTQGLAIEIPDAGNPDGSYSGGAFTDSATAGRDLTEYNALTFWAKASTSATLDVAGIGNDNTGTSKYTAQIDGMALSTDWQQYVIPIPDPSKLDMERGLFFFAEGPEGGLGYDIWIDEILYDSLATITNPQPAVGTYSIDVDSGETVTPNNGTVVYDVSRAPVTVNAMPGYFEFSSSDPSVVQVDVDGTITAVGVGTATLTADLGAVAATGMITVNVSGEEPVPAVAAPTPTEDPGDVISLFSDAYTDEPVDTWLTVWSNAQGGNDFLVAGNATKLYTDLVFAGVEFVNPTIDISTMTHFHMDVWTPDPTDAPAVFNVKLVDFGPDGMFDGGDDTEHELSFDENTMDSESWVSIDVPLTAFAGLTTKGHLAQLIISGDPNTVYVDNVYFYDAGAAPTEPTTAAPTPSEDPGDVISMYSDAYTDVTVDTYLTGWSDASMTPVVIDSDNMLKYTSLVFAGIETITSPVDASAMTHFRMDVWTPDPTADPAVFNVKFVDLGADGAFGGGDDVEHEVTLDETTMDTGIWTTIDLPLANFTGLTTRAHIGQLIISGDPNTLFVSNMYFYDSGTPTQPATAAPAPSEAPGDVISMYSDAYTDVTVDTYLTGWSDASMTPVVIDSDNMLNYTSLVFAGIETIASPVDASTMTNLRMDVWTPDPTAAPAVFRIKLVDLGGDGVFGGGDDVEHEVVLGETVMDTGSWVSIDVPLADFTGLTTQGAIGQMIISRDAGLSPYPSTVFISNIYFYK